MAYSPKNGHIFVRAEVCCTCGSDESDTLECGRYGASNITLTIDGTDVVEEGQCGRHCRGGPTDTIGVMEFDPATEKVIGQHSFVGSAPVNAPFASPDGEHIILFGMNGGKTVEILKAGSSGFKSVRTTTPELSINPTGFVDSTHVFFIHSHNRALKPPSRLTSTLQMLKSTMCSTTLPTFSKAT